MRKKAQWPEYPQYTGAPYVMAVAAALETLSESSASPPYTHILVINGSACAVCNGPICCIQKKDPPCVYSTSWFISICKKCCLCYQKKTQEHCKEARHAHALDVVTTITNTDTFTSEPGVSPVSAPQTKPSKLTIVPRTLWCSTEIRVKANWLILQKAVEERLKQNITIYFWNLQ